MTTATSTTGKVRAQDMEQAGQMPVYIPDTDVYESSDMIQILCDMPGVPQDNVSVSMENNVLLVKGSQQECPREGYDCLHCGFSPGVFKRSFSIFSDIDTGGISAKINNGVLTVRLPKAEKAKARKIQVSSE